MSGLKKEIIIYVLLCLGLSNVCWVLGYLNPNSDFSTIFIVVASFLPMVLALIVTKITKEGWNNLGVVLNLKKAWKTYLLSIFGTLAITYLSYPLMYWICGNQVAFNLTWNTMGEIGMATLFGILCCVECLGEELGWIGYLFPKLEKVTGTVWACVIVGIIRGMYHIGILIFMGYPIQQFLELTLSNICLSFFMVYMYKKSGSVLPCSIQHAIMNLLPIFMVYEESWYYTSVIPIVLCMISAFLFGGYGLWQLKRQKLAVCRCNNFS